MLKDQALAEKQKAIHCIERDHTLALAQAVDGVTAKERRLGHDREQALRREHETELGEWKRKAAKAQVMRAWCDACIV